MTGDEKLQRDQAEAIAREEERDARGGSGAAVRNSARQFEGLDGFRKKGFPAPQFPALDRAARDRRSRPTKAEEAGMEKGGGAGGGIISAIKELGAGLARKFDELKNATQGTVGDKTRPANAA